MDEVAWLARGAARRPPGSPGVVPRLLLAERLRLGLGSRPW